MTKFCSGDRVFHSVHGLGTVEKPGNEYIGVLFDRHGRALLKLSEAPLRLATNEDIFLNQEEAPKVQEALPWPDSTFLNVISCRYVEFNHHQD